MRDDLTAPCGAAATPAAASERAAARLAEAAEDAACSTSPTRRWTLRSGRSTPRGRRGAWSCSPTATSPLDERLERLARGSRRAILEAPARLDPVRRQLDEYFAGRRRRFDVPIDWSPLHGYTREVLRRTAEIPYGQASSYAEIAGRAGSPRGWRAAGNALGANPMPIVVPCHRVLASSGEIGGYTGGLDRKRFLLALEGVETDDARREGEAPRRARRPGGQAPSEGPSAAAG